MESYFVADISFSTRLHQSPEQILRTGLNINAPDRIRTCDLLLTSEEIEGSCSIQAELPGLNQIKKELYLKCFYKHLLSLCTKHLNKTEIKKTQKPKRMTQNTTFKIPNKSLFSYKNNLKSNNILM